MSIFGKNVVLKQEVETPLDEVEIPETPNTPSPSDDDLFEATNEVFDQIEQEGRYFEQTQTEICQLLDMTTAIESFGITPTAKFLLKKHILLSQTALPQMALESLTTEVALESIGSTIKDKVAAWSAKVIAVAKTAGDKIISVLDPIYSSITGMFVKVEKSPEGQSKDNVKAEILAHPYKTALIAVTAVTALVGVIYFVANGMPQASASKTMVEGFKAKVAEMTSKIHWPFGKSEKMVKGTAANLGWTKSSTRFLKDKLDGVWVALKHALSALGAKTMVVSRQAFQLFNTTLRETVPKFVENATGSREAGQAAAFAGGGIVFWSVYRIVWKVWKLVKKFAVATFKYIWSSLRKLVSFVF